MTQHQCTATLFLAKGNHHWPVLLCKTGCQQACGTFSTSRFTKLFLSTTELC